MLLEKLLVFRIASSVSATNFTFSRPLSLASSGLMNPLRSYSCSALLVVVLVCLLKSGFAEETSSRMEGVYHLNTGFQFETLELRGGRFRYWFGTDYGAETGDKPLAGTYSIEGSTLILQGAELHLGNRRILHPLGNLLALWRPFALEEWRSTGEINQYGIIVKLPHPPEKLSDPSLPLPDEVRTALRGNKERPGK
jgi:hypothetical protein